MRSFQIQAVAALLLTSSLFSLSSCSKGNHSDAPIDRAAPIVFDSIRKGKIDTMAMQINEIVNSKGISSKKIPYPVYNPQDSIGFLFTEDHHGRISMNTHPDSNIVWPYFWVYDGEPIIMRLRHHDKNMRLRHHDKNAPERYASETVVYMDKGRIIYCNERKKILHEGEIPGAVQNEPFVKSTRTYGEIETEFKKYWTEVTTEMKKQNVLPEWIKS
jgi:hypothetical protein